MRFFPLLAFCLLAAPLRADALSERLRLLVPGEDAPTVNERQFLYRGINRLLLELEADRTGRKSVKKRIRRINDRLRRKYFRRAVPDATLADALRHGRYNDATATLLTALVYERFDLTYELYVDHYRSYLLADPDGRATVVTAPNLPRPTEKRAATFRVDYLDLLRSTVLDDAPAPGEVQETFRRYFYDPARRLSLGQLAAYHHYRRAQTAYRNRRFQEALDLLSVALEREERPAFLVLRHAARLQLKAITQPEIEGDVTTLFRQWNERPDNRYLPAALLRYFDDRQQLLMATDSTGAAAQLLVDFRDRAPAGHEDWANQLADLHQYRLLTHYFLGGQNDMARQLAERLYAANPTDERIKYVLGEIVIDGLRRSRLTGDKFTAAVAAAGERYPFVRQQDRFADLYLREMAWAVRDRYEADDPAGGQAALKRFRESLVGISVDEDRSTWTLTAFLAASNYHFRQGNYGRARELVDLGLRYNPADPYLLHRRELLLRY